MHFCWRVLGFGNILKRDDGFGPHFINYLKKDCAFTGMELFELGTGVADLFYMLSFKGGVIIVDAFHGGGGKPGDLYFLETGELLNRCSNEFSTNCIEENTGYIAAGTLSKEASFRINLHATDMVEVINQARYCYGNCLADPIYLLGVEVNNVDWGMEMTPRVKESLPRAKELVLNVLNGCR